MSMVKSRRGTAAVAAVPCASPRRGELHRRPGDVLESPARGRPYVIGIAGEVRRREEHDPRRLLQALLGRWPDPRASISSRPRGFTVPERGAGGGGGPDGAQGLQRATTSARERFLGELKAGATESARAQVLALTPTCVPDEVIELRSPHRPTSCSSEGVSKCAEAPSRRGAGGKWVVSDFSALLDLVDSGRRDLSDAGNRPVLLLRESPALSPLVLQLPHPVQRGRDARVRPEVCGPRCTSSSPREHSDRRAVVSPRGGEGTATKSRLRQVCGSSSQRDTSVQ